MPTYTQSTKPVPGSLKIVELFETVQGEGIHIGVPSVFVRTGMCNLECSGCDTKWNEWKENDTAFVAGRIMGFQAKHVVITGGEPTLWQDELEMLIRILGLRYVITIETNGAVPITNEYLLGRVNLWSFSPKVGSLGHDEKFSRTVVVDNIRKILTFAPGRRVQIKYVLDPNISAHVDSVFDFQDRVNAAMPGMLSDDRIFFQPYDRGTLVNIYARQVAFNINAEYDADLTALTKLVMDRSGSRFRVVPQLHKYINFR